MGKEVSKKSNIPTQPQTLFQLFLCALEGFVKGLKWRAIFGLGTFLTVMIVHTYLLAVVNDGFRVEDNSILKYILATPVNRGTSYKSWYQILDVNLFWTLISMAFWGSIARMRSFGLKRFILDILVELKDFFLYTFSKKSNVKIAALGILITIALLAGMFAGNPLTFLLLSVVIFLSVSMKERSGILLFMKVAQSDFRRLFKLKSRQFNIIRSSAVLRSILLGFLISAIFSFVKYGLYFKIGILVCLIALIVFSIRKGNSAVASSFIAVTLFLLFNELRVFADDGGFRESGNSFWIWIKNDGAKIALICALGPSAWAGLIPLFFILPKFKSEPNGSMTSGADNAGEAQNDVYVPSLSGPLYEGVSNADVKTLQHMLNQLGYTDAYGNKLAEDGAFGPRTREAVNKYKTDKPIYNEGEYKGVVGNDTWKSLWADASQHTDAGDGQVNADGAGDVAPSGTDNSVSELPTLKNTQYQSMIENIEHNTSLGLSRLHKTSMEYIAITLLNNGYPPAFVAGILGNIQSEGLAGMFEGIDVTTKNIPNYKDYSSKNIRTIGIKSAQELQTACANAGQQFGLGAIQWTGSRTQTLLDCYKEVCGDNNFPTELECLEAENLCVARELNDSYYNNRVYQYWSKNYSSDDAKSAGEVVCRKYEIPDKIDSEATKRANQADQIYKIMIGAE